MTFPKRFFLPGILILVAVLYGGVLLNSFVWDDNLLFVDNAALRSGSIDWAMLSRPVMEGATYLRPLVLLTWALEAKAWGVDPVAAHAVNLLLHLFNVSLVFVLAHHVLRLLGIPGTDWRAAVAAVAYAVHPSLVEVTAWVSGRFDLMATAFILCALIADGAIVGRWCRALVLSALFALALGCKELALILPPILLCMRMVRRPIGEHRIRFWREAFAIIRHDAPTVVALGVVFVIWVLLRLDTFGAVLHHSDVISGQPTGRGLLLHVLLVFNTVYFYAVEIVLPFTRVSPLHPLDVGMLTTPIGIGRAMGGAAVVGSVATLLVRRPAAGLLLTCVVLALLPVLQVVPLSSTAKSIGNDRFLTLPLVFVAIALATIRLPITLRIGPRIQLLSAGMLGIGWLLIGAATIAVTIPQWRNEWSLWTSVYQKHPDSEFAQRAYLHVLMQNQRYDLAGALFESLRKEGPLHSFVQIQYGIYLLRIGEQDEAENYIWGGLAAHGIPVNGTLADNLHTIPITDRLIMGYAYSALSEIEQLRGHFEQALAYIEESVRFLPHMPIYEVVKALLLIATDRVGEGTNLYTGALEKIVPEKRGTVAEGAAMFLAELCQQHNQPPRIVCMEPDGPAAAIRTAR